MNQTFCETVFRNNYHLKVTNELVCYLAVCYFSIIEVIPIFQLRDLKI